MKVLVIGASLNPARYAFLATEKLLEAGNEVLLYGNKEADFQDIKIQTVFPVETDIHTITLYVNPIAQKELYQSILNTGAKRIIFNPGTENPELEKLAQQRGMETLQACTLVMLATNQF